jgi:L-threonylcarbamoyladenylate synthase
MRDTVRPTDSHFDFTAALSVLGKGGILLFPGDAHWCVGGDATDAAVARRLRSQGLVPTEGPLTLLVGSVGQLKEYQPDLHPRIETLLLYHRRPLTLCFTESRRLPPEVAGPDGAVWMQLALDPYCRGLLSRWGKPLVALPAHMPGTTVPAHFGEISSAVLELADHVVPYRQLERQSGVPPAVARLSEADELVFLPVQNTNQTWSD